VPFLFAAACASLVLVALVLLPGPASAHNAYQHGGIDDCETCHENAHTDRTPPSDACYSCHFGYQLVRTREVCWTCHTPGQDMSWARTDASCLTTCHLRGGVESAHTTHAGATSGCTSCHSLTESPAQSAGSAHHTVPAPRLDFVAPAAGVPGAGVTLTGAKFTWAVLVRFGGVEAAFTVLSDTSISAVVPPAAVTGPVTVLTGGGSAASLADFTVLSPPPPPQPPALTLKASQSTLRLGRRVRLTGRLLPAGAAPQVRVVVQRRVSGAWKSVASSPRDLDASGACAWSYRPLRAGAFRARASAAGVVSAWAGFRVR
jgi:hypothetical protein